MPSTEALVTAAAVAAIGWMVKAIFDRLSGYINDSVAWRGRLDAKLDVITDATQTTMRTQLLHYAEKYLTRGWITPEERASIMDMHEKYSSLNANGYIDGYMQRVAELPDREI